MRKFKLISPFILIMAFLTAFSPSDTIIKDSTKKATKIDFKVENIEENQNPETVKSYELITNLQNQKNTIQESIDSIFNVIDSLQSIAPDTNRHNPETILFNTQGSIKSNSIRQHKQNKRKDNKIKDQSNNLFTKQHIIKFTKLPNRKRNLADKKQKIKDNNFTANRPSSCINSGYFFIS
jgi:hypothetical protein